MNFDTASWYIFGIIISVGSAIISYFLKRTMTQTDEHEKSIKEIQLTYVTKDELKEVKSDVNKGLTKMQSDIEEIKEQTLTKADYYRQQTITDKKIDKIYDLLLKQQGGQQ